MSIRETAAFVAGIVVTSCWWLIALRFADLAQ